MLVLSRRVGETVIVGDQVKVTVLRIIGTQVRLGIAAPKDIPVHREEIRKTMHTTIDDLDAEIT